MFVFLHSVVTYLSMHILPSDIPLLQLYRTPWPPQNAGRCRVMKGASSIFGPYFANCSCNDAGEDSTTAYFGSTSARMEKPAPHTPQFSQHASLAVLSQTLKPRWLWSHS